MLPSGKILTIIGLVSFCSNWQFGFQITYINTASRSFYQLADEIYDQNSPNIPSSDIPPAKNVSSSERWPHLPMHQWSEEWSTIVSSFYAGALIGFILVPQLIRRVGGVRNALLCSSLPAVLGCVLQLSVRLSANNLMFDLVLSFGRLLVGIQAGCSLCLLPLFIIETSAFGHRPFLSSLQQVFQSLATLLGLVVGSDSLLALGPYKLEWLQIISLAPTLFFILFLIWLPETPFRLLEKCQTDDFSLDNDEDELQLAFERSSLFYYGSQADFCAIRDEAFNRWRIPTGSNRYRKRRPFVDNLKGLIVGTFASISFAFTADDIIDSYSAEFLNRSSNTPDASAETLTALLGLLLFISSIFGALLVDRIGRRRLLISGLLGTSLSNLFAAIGASKASAWMVTSGFAFTKAFIGFGAGAPAWFLTSELVSPLFVAQAQAISTGSLLVVTGLCTLFFLSLQGWVGSAGALLLLSSVPALIIAILLFLLLPETQELSFDQVYQLLCSHPLAGLAQHPRWSRALLRPLLLHEGEKVDADHRWGHAWELPHRAQRLMSASSYVSYGSMHSHPAHIHFTRPPLYRRHSAQPPSEGHRQQQTMQNPGDSLEAAPRNSLTRSSTFTSPKL